jgi:hypothetical protein
MSANSFCFFCGAPKDRNRSFISAAPARNAGSAPGPKAFFSVSFSMSGKPDRDRCREYRLKAARCRPVDFQLFVERNFLPLACWCGEDIKIHFEAAAVVGGQLDFFVHIKVLTALSPIVPMRKRSPRCPRLSIEFARNINTSLWLWAISVSRACLVALGGLTNRRAPCHGSGGGKTSLPPI